MCSPTLIVTAVAAGYQAYSSVQQANAQAKGVEVTAQNNAKIAEYNANIQENAAKDAERRGANDTATVRQNVQRSLATGRANTASSGLLTDTGSNLKTQGDNAGAGELNALTVSNNASREAYGDRMGAQSTLFQSATDTANAKYQSRIIKQNGLLQAGGNLITGAANYGKAGGFNPSSYKSWSMQ